MTDTLAERFVNRIAHRVPGSTSRRGFLGGAALVGAALAADPVSYLTRPASAYASLCGTDATCAAGYSVFCCTINGGRNSCPPNSFIGGWWKADHSSYCGGAARYYIDCNAYRSSAPPCRCNTTSCDHRLVACNQFRYGQCNLQIPASQTGPVFCRLVSCSPPWQQFGGVCTSSSATDNNTVGHTAPCVADHPPGGHLDHISSSGTRVNVTGWAYDPDASSTAIQISIHEDARIVGRFPTGRLRTDVNRAFHIVGYHGFNVTFTGRPGLHTYRVYAIGNVATAPYRLIGSSRLRVDRPPTGHLDAVLVNGTTVRVRGWALDPDTPTAEVRISIHENSRIVGTFPTGVPRPDVNRAVHTTGNHGFDITFTTTPGTYTYTVYAFGTAAGGPWAAVGSRSVTVG